MIFMNSPELFNIYGKFRNMDINKLDKALLELAKKRKELETLDYSNPKYDDIEEQLHDLEDDFQETFGEDMENVLQAVHDKYCPDSDVLLPIAYMGNGVLVEADQYPGKEVKLTIAGGPPRIVLSVGRVNPNQEVVWEGA